MKILSLLFFVFTLPIAALLAAIPYGGFSTEILKTELAKSGVYEKILSAPSESSSEEQTYESREDQLVSSFARFLTPDFMEQKVNTVIDDSAQWISGKSDNPPVLSLKELKDEIEKKNPGLINEMLALSKEMEQIQITETATQQNNEQSEFLTNFVKNDFSIPLKEHFMGIKQAYQSIVIIVPVLIVLILLSLVGLFFLNHTWSMRLRWVGLSLAVAGVWGYAFLAGIIFLSHAGLGLISGINDDELLPIIYPLIEKIITFFINHYSGIQITVSIGFVIAGMIGFILSFIIKENNSTPVKAATKSVQKTKKSS